MTVKPVGVSHALLPTDTTIPSSLHIHHGLLPHQLPIHQNKEQITVQNEKKKRGRE